MVNRKGLLNAGPFCFCLSLYFCLILVRVKNTSYYRRESLFFFLYSALYFIWNKGGLLVSKLERDFQAKLISELKDIFHGCLVMKLDSSYIQGIPDLLVLYNDKWAVLECKKSANSHKQPNQEYYVDLMNRMSFSRFIYPSNKDEVLTELYLHFDH